MMDWIVQSPANLYLVLASTLGIYIALIVFARMAGLRSFSKMSGFDFAVTVAFGSVIASVVIAENPPLVQGIVALAALFAIQMVFAALRLHIGWIEGLSTNTPRLIMIGSEIQEDQMAKAKITRSDLQSKLREANVLNYGQVIAVVAETTGDVSVLHRKDEAYDTFDPALLDGVIGVDRLRDWIAETGEIDTPGESAAASPA